MRWRRILVAVFLLVAVLIVGFIIFWQRQESVATDVALQRLVSDESVLVTEEDDYIIFEPAGNVRSIGFAFYPGGAVDHRAYAPVLYEIAARGYIVGLVEVPLNLAILDTDAASILIEARPQVEEWVVGGHSLGGVAAAMFAEAEPVAGLVLWASTPASDALRDDSLGVTSIYGSRDGLFTLQDAAESRVLLPLDTMFVEIAGGNHAQFGAYGFQEGDMAADISAEEQWRQVAEATAVFLSSLE